MNAYTQGRHYFAKTVRKHDGIRGGMSTATFKMSAEQWCDTDGACVRTSPAYKSLTVLTTDTRGARGQRYTTCKHQKQNGHT